MICSVVACTHMIPCKCTAGQTVEERILELHSRKKFLAASIGATAEDMKKVCWEWWAAHGEDSRCVVICVSDVVGVVHRGVPVRYLQISTFSGSHGRFAVTLHHDGLHFTDFINLQCHEPCAGLGNHKVHLSHYNDYSCGSWHSDIDYFKCVSYTILMYYSCRV